MKQHFGLHVDGDLVFLHQGRWGRCVTPGLEGLAAPERIMRHDFRRCPHDIKLAPGPTPEPTGLVKALAPIPDGAAYWVPSEAIDAVSQAYVMCSPVQPVVFAAWNTPIRKLAPQLSLTNIAPLIITGVRPIDAHAVIQLLRLPRVRTILFCTDVQPRNTEAIDWTLPSVSDWRRAGSALLHQHILRTVDEARHADHRTAGKVLGPDERTMG